MKSSRESDKPIIRIGENVRNKDRIVDDHPVACSSRGRYSSESTDIDSITPSSVAAKKRDCSGAFVGVNFPGRGDNTNRDDNYSEEDSMSCTNCTDYSEDDISMKELDQLTNIGKFLAGMRQQHTTGRESAASGEGEIHLDRHKRRGSEDKLRRERENVEKNFKRENESCRSKFEYGRGRNSIKRDKSMDGNMRRYVNLEGHVTRCEITKSSNKNLVKDFRSETSSSSYKYIVERRVSRSNSEQEKGLLRSYRHHSLDRDEEKSNFVKEEYKGLGCNDLKSRILSHCNPMLETSAHSNTTTSTRFSN